MAFVHIRCLTHPEYGPIFWAEDENGKQWYAPVDLSDPDWADNSLISLQTAAGMYGWCEKAYENGLRSIKKVEL